MKQPQTKTTIPLMLFRTSGGTPFRFEPHSHDVGHTLFINPSKLGKSVLDEQASTAEGESDAKQS